MEIERKFTLKQMPDNLDSYPSHHIEQAYLCTNPVVRIRKQDDQYILTYKGQGMMAREEHNLPLTKEAYYHLREKADGNIISKKRYKIPLPNNLTIELDIFAPPFSPLVMAEVEFPTEADAESFLPPDWFDKDVTYNKEYHNSYLSGIKF